MIREGWQQEPGALRAFCLYCGGSVSAKSGYALREEKRKHRVRCKK